MMDRIDPDISFIVPLYNAENTVRETLQSIADLNTFRKIEIWIVDDASTDRSREVAQEWIEAIQGRNDRLSAYLIVIEHGGEAAAMNAGLARASAPVIAWVESDVRLDRDWLERLMPEIEKEKVAGAGGLLLPAETDPAIARIFGYEIAYKIQSNRADALHITSANALYRREVFEQLGPCRTDLGESSFDSEFNHRLREAGWRLRCNPEARAWHHFKTRLSDCLIRTWWYGFRRPFVQSQVLYPFDRFIALSVLLSGLVWPAFILLWLKPLAFSIVVGGIAAVQILYSLFLYSHFPDTVLFVSPLIFWLRNSVFLNAYCIGLLYYWTATKSRIG